MKLEDLYTNILDMDTPALLAYIVSYTNKRTFDLLHSVPAVQAKTKAKTKKQKTSSSAGKITVTADQLDLLRKLKLI